MVRSRETLIAPSILSADFAKFGEECAAVERAGADRIHVDVMDGHFVPNITFGSATCAAIRNYINTSMDVHLMVSPVDSHIGSFVKAGADSIIVHVEAETHVHKTLQTIRQSGIQSGIAINPSTPAMAIQYLLDLTDIVCVMTVNPGFGGQMFIASQLAKIREISGMIGDKPIDLHVDGGISCETAPAAAEAGANVLIAGTTVFSRRDANGTVDLRKNIEDIRRSVKSSSRVVQV